MCSLLVPIERLLTGVLVLQVYERRGCEQDKGITLAIAPNAGRVYHRWGFDLKEMCGGVQAFQVAVNV